MGCVVPADAGRAVVAAMQATAPARAIFTHDNARAAKVNERRASTDLAAIPASIVTAYFTALLDTHSA